MKIILPLMFVLLVSFPAAAQKRTVSANQKKVWISAEDERLRGQLKNDKSLYTLNCGLFEVISPNTPFSQSRINAQRENTRIRLLLYEASLARDKTVKAKMQCDNVGGNDSPYYMLVENGRIKYMGDYIPDGKGGLKLDSLYCDRLKIGAFAARPEDGILDFKSIDDSAYGDRALILQCQVGERSFIF